MKVGDKKQAVLLSAVAVGAVAFLFMQLKKPGSGASATASVAAKETVAEAPASSELPKRVYGDPFYHPLLVQQEAKNAVPGADGSKSAQEGSGKYVKKPLRIVGTLPGVTQNSGPGPIPYADAQAEPEPPTKKVEAAAPRQPALTLSAVVTGRHPVALVAIDNNPSSQYVKGQTIAKGIYVSRIREDAIEISFLGKRKTVALQVGKKLQL